MGSILLGISLLALGVGMIAWQWAIAHRRQPADSATEDINNFARRQLRRRTRAGGLVALLGVFVLLGPLVSNHYLQAVYWSGAMLVVVWVVILAVADMMRTRQHFDELQSQYLMQQAALEAEVQRLRRQQSNGDKADEDSG